MGSDSQTFQGREILQAVHLRLSDPLRWTSGSLAEDAEGRHVDPNDPSAVRWCLRGAYIRELGSEPQRTNLGPATRDPLWHRVIQASMSIYGTGPIGVNDGEGREGALCVLEWAISGR